MLDLHLFPLHIKNSIEQAYLSGLHFSIAPRNSVRSRQNDQLIVLLSSIGEQAIPGDKLTALLEKSSAEYFRSTGTVTSGIKKSADLINDSLLEFNLKESTGNNQQSCTLNVVVIHEDRAYIGHVGYTHTFILSKSNTEHFFDPEVSGRGLGLSRTVSVRYFLAELKSEEYILFSPEPLATWTPSNLAGSPSIALDYLRRRLLNQVSPNIRALLIQALGGSGKIILEAPLSSKSAFFPSPAQEPLADKPTQNIGNGKTIPQMAAANPNIQTTPAKPSPASGRSDLLAGQRKQIQQLDSRASGQEINPDDDDPSIKESLSAIRTEIAERFGLVKNGITGFFARFKKAPAAADGNLDNTPKGFARININTEPIKQRLTFVGKGAARAAEATGKSLQSASHTMGGVFGDAVEYITPEGGFKLPRLSTGVMVLISIAIPLLIVGAASSIYFNRGRSSQYDTYFAQAQSTAAQAASFKDPRDVRKVWQDALVLLDKAEKYRKTDSSTALRQQGQDVLDDITGIARINYDLAIKEGLPATVKIIRMKATSTDLYMLDSSEGRILRAVLTGRGFEVDPSFQCNPGPYGSYTVDSLIDMAIMPKGNSLGASIAALDGRGNIVYCGSGIIATSMTLTPPDTGWGAIRSIAIDSGRLYVLDTTANAVWVYYGSNGTFSESPGLFFDTEIPPLEDVIDFTISGNDLFLLHQDGHLTTCVFSDISGSPTKCKDPSPFSITRPGIENKPIIVPDTTFLQIHYSSPPDPSIYLLDGNSVSIYHFSVRLAMQKQLSVQSDDPNQLLNRKPTAFTISPSKTVFMAFGNKVFSGLEP